MNKKILYSTMGLAGLFFTASTVNAASVNFVVDIQEADDNGVAVGPVGKKNWDLSDGALWTSTALEGGHVMNDLISTTTKWKNGGSFGSSAEIYINDLSFDMDPSLSFNFTLENNTASNQIYTVAYNTPLLPNLSGTVDSSSNLTATLTDNGGVAGAKMAPANGNGNIMRAWDIAVNGNQISKNVDVGSAFTISNGSAFNSWSAINTLECGYGDSACESMSVVLTLMLSKGDKVELQGSVVQTIQAVPLPASAWLFGSAIAVLGFRRRVVKA